MISRRLIRIKVLQELYAFFRSDDKDVVRGQRELMKNLDSVYLLYHYLLYFAIEIKDFAKEKIEKAKKKYLPTEEDLNPNTKFINSQLIQKLEANKQLMAFVKENKIKLLDDRILIRETFKKIIESKVYNTYMGNEEQSFEEDKILWYKIFYKVLYNFEYLYQYLGDKDLFWNSDIEFVIRMVTRTIKTFEENSGENHQLLSQYKNDEDKEFTKKLYIKVISNTAKNKELINKCILNWDPDRLSQIDKLIIQMAVTEILEFPTIPINASFNEYIEIAKQYGGENSSVFINGILDRIIKELQEKGEIKKTGTGLINKN